MTMEKILKAWKKITCDNRKEKSRKLQKDSMWNKVDGWLSDLKEEKSKKIDKKDIQLNY